MKQKKLAESKTPAAEAKAGEDPSKEISDIQQQITGLITLMASPKGAKSRPIAGNTLQGRDEQGLTVLMCACQCGDEETTRILLKDHKLKDNQTTQTGATALHLATEKGHSGIVEQLLQQFVYQCDTPFLVEIDDGHGQKVLANYLNIRLLINGKRGDTPLTHAVFSKNPNIVRQLINAGADTNAIGHADLNVMEWAFGNFNEDKVADGEALELVKEVLGEENSEQKEPQAQNPGEVQTNLQPIVLVSFKTLRTGIDRAAIKNKPITLIYLLNYLNDQPGMEWTLKFLQDLIELVILGKPNFVKTTAKAKQETFEAIVKFFVSKVSLASLAEFFQDLIEKILIAQYNLAPASEKDKLEVFNTLVEFLLAQKIPFNLDGQRCKFPSNPFSAKDKEAKANQAYRCTLLIWASQQGFSMIVTRLVELGVSVNGMDTDNRTAFYYAMQLGNYDIWKTLIPKADPQTRDLLLCEMMYSFKPPVPTIEDLQKFMGVIFFYGARINTKFKIEGGDFDLLSHAAKNGRFHLIPFIWETTSRTGNAPDENSIKSALKQLINFGKWFCAEHNSSKTNPHYKTLMETLAFLLHLLKTVPSFNEFPYDKQDPNDPALMNDFWILLTAEREKRAVRNDPATAEEKRLKAKNSELDQETAFQRQKLTKASQPLLALFSRPSDKKAEPVPTAEDKEEKELESIIAQKNLTDKISRIYAEIERLYNAKRLHCVNPRTLSTALGLVIAADANANSKRELSLEGQQQDQLLSVKLCTMLLDSYAYEVLVTPNDKGEIALHHAAGGTNAVNSQQIMDLLLTKLPYTQLHYRNKNSSALQLASRQNNDYLQQKVQEGTIQWGDYAFYVTTFIPDSLTDGGKAESSAAVFFPFKGIVKFLKNSLNDKVQRVITTKLIWPEDREDCADLNIAYSITLFQYIEACVYSTFGIIRGMEHNRWLRALLCGKFPHNRNEFAGRSISSEDMLTLRQDVEKANATADVQIKRLRKEFEDWESYRKIWHSKEQAAFMEEIQQTVSVEAKQLNLDPNKFSVLQLARQMCLRLVDAPTPSAPVAYSSPADVKDEGPTLRMAPTVAKLPDSTASHASNETGGLNTTGPTAVAVVVSHASPMGAIASTLAPVEGTPSAPPLYPPEGISPATFQHPSGQVQREGLGSLANRQP